MWRVARHVGFEYSILTLGEALDGRLEGERVECRDPSFTRQLLRGMADDLALAKFRTIVVEASISCVWLRGCSDRDVIERLADLLARGRLVLQREKIAYPPPLVRVDKPKRPAARAEERPDSWIEIRVVDDESGDPFAGVGLKVTASDRSLGRATSDRDGGAWLDRIVGGPCSVSSPRKEGEGTVLDTAAFVGIGESPVGKQEASDQVQTSGKEVQQADGRDQETEAKPAPAPAPAVRRARHIAKITEHRVKTGDTLEKLAARVDLSTAELARFNWGIDDPKEIDSCLGGFVGCTRRDEDGRHVLDDSDSPGIIYLPEPWEQGGLSTEQKHTIRVRLLPTWVRMLYQLDVDEPAAKDDTIFIKTDDGSWTYEIPVGSLSEVEPDWVELLFPRPPPGKRYSMIQDLGKDGDPIVIFEGRDESVFWVTDPDLVELYEPGADQAPDEDSDEPPDLDEDEPPDPDEEEPPDPDEEWDDELLDEDLEE